LFFLDSKGMPPVVTGVPPDSFNPEAGQRWGHPVYYWRRHRDENFRWWISRVEATLKQVDVVRIDHFRGFWDYFEVPATDLYTTKNGRWVEGPRDSFFKALGAQLQSQIIAEDLGDKMEEVVAWRERLGLPGMKILQFAFGGSEEEQARFGPDHIEPNSVVYTGTHDNRTSLGWWQNEATPEMRDRVTALFARMRDQWLKKPGVEAPNPTTIPVDLDQPAWVMIQIGMMSGGNTLIIPLQDVLNIDDTGRQNSPGDPDLSKNWKWRYGAGDLTADSAAALRALTHYYHRGA
jgi:4-alpha-glucanotransferase